MSRTYRRNYKNEPIRDGEHGKKCPSYKCEICGKIWYRSLMDRLWKRELRNWEEDQ